MWTESNHMNTKFYTDDKHNIDDPNGACMSLVSLVRLS